MNTSDKKVSIFFDYACPFCYAGVSYLDDLREDFPNIALEWIPVEAHTRDEGDRIITPEDEHWWATTLQERHSLPQPIKVSVSPAPYGDRAIYGFYFVQEQGGDIWAYHRAVYKAIFQDKQNIEQTEVLVACAKQAGVNLEEFKQAVEDNRYEKTLKSANHYAYGTLGIEYIPTFISGEHRLDSLPSRGVTRESLRELLLAL